MAVLEMGIEISWNSKRGQRTDDNWDCCGIGLKPEAVLCVVLDGSTAGPTGGELVRQIARDLVDWFVETDNRMTADILIERLHHIHKSRSQEFRSDSASYLIALIESQKQVLVLHAGDCLAGRHDGKVAIDWIIQPHTLSNAIIDVPIPKIATSPLRNRLTRSFRAREFMSPDISNTSVEGDEALIVATDGFWAELDSNDQLNFLAGEDLPTRGDQDDCSALRIQFLDHAKDVQVIGGQLENLYLANSF